MENDLKNLKFNKSSDGKKQSAYVKIFLLVAVLLVSIYAIYWFFTSSGSSALEMVFNKNQIEQTEGRVNVLLLGNAGGSHDGATLTDSIIVASYDTETNKATLFSLPRDLWLDNVGAKVNTVYQRGKKETGDGLKYSEEKIGDILGLKIHYGVRLDFNGFAKAIDLVEGLDVEVPKDFDDYVYPIEGKEDELCDLVEKEVEITKAQFNTLELPPGTPTSPGSDDTKIKVKALVGPSDKIATESSDFACRYEHIHFETGKTHMDGETALKFVRSRHGTNGEGSDFARSRRQQVVLDAFRAKVLSLETLLDPGKLFGLATTFGNSFETDITQDKFLHFYNLSKKLKGTENIVLGDLGKGESLLVVGQANQYGGAFVMVPKNDNWQSIPDFIKSKLEATASASLAPSSSPK